MDADAGGHIVIPFGVVRNDTGGVGWGGGGSEQLPELFFISLISAHRPALQHWAIIFHRSRCHLITSVASYGARWERRSAAGMKASETQYL